MHIESTGLFQPELSLKLDVGQFLKKFMVYPGRIQKQLHIGHLQNVMDHTSIQRQISQNKLWAAMLEKVPNKPIEGIGFFCDPVELRATTAHKAGTLNFFPYTNLQNIRLVEGAPKESMVTIVYDKATWALSAPPTAKTVQTDKWSDDAVCVPYWWVGTTKNTDDVNMEFKKIALGKGNHANILVRFEC